MSKNQKSDNTIINAQFNADSIFEILEVVFWHFSFTPLNFATPLTFDRPYILLDQIFDHIPLLKITKMESDI